MKPILQALLVADHVYTDSVTGKKIVAGIFQRLWFKKAVAQEVRQEAGETKTIIPINPGGQQAGSPFCYISVTDVHGSGEFELRYVDLSDDRVLFNTQFRVDSQDPLQTIEIGMPLPMLPANKVGTFVLELLWNNESLGSHRIIVGQLAEDKPPKQ